MNSLSIAPQTVVTLDYAVNGSDGQMIDQSDDQPLEVLIGAGQLVEGLEQALIGRMAGEQLSVTVPPERGYGQHEHNRVLVVSRFDLPKHVTPELGIELTYEAEDGEGVSMWITDMVGDRVTLDANHPLAGKALYFKVTILAVRHATPDEIEHGHAHSSDGEDDFEAGHYTH